ncbi:MAG TPA: hypothetical protein PLV45_05760 [bacterium]|nr:hypothetical protein [bacterium]
MVLNVREKILAGLLTVLLLAPVSQAQIVLAPQATGTAIHRWERSFYVNWMQITTRFYSTETYDVATPGIWAGYTGSSSFYSEYPISSWWCNRNWLHGIIEFNILETIDGNPFPTAAMTPYNWTAQLKGMIVESGGSTGPGATLYDLGDACENGAVQTDDFDCILAESTPVITFTVPPDGSELGSIDITAILRRDLFGAGSGDPTSGLLLTSDADGFKIAFNSSSPRVDIFRVDPTSTPEPTPSPSPTPEPTPTIPPLGIDLKLSQHEFFPGDPFVLTAWLSNPGPDPYVNRPMVILLEVGASFFWYPDWSMEFDTEPVDLIVGIRGLNILSFQWPDTGNTGFSAIFYGALLSRDLSTIVGTWDSESFSW